MPQLSAFTPCGLLELSSQPSYAETAYLQLQQLLNANDAANGQGFDFAQGEHLEAWTYATAMGLADHRWMLERAGNQAEPMRAMESLPLLELDFELTPGPKDSFLTRQQAIAAAELLPLGGNSANLLAGLQTLLGASFIDLIVPTPTQRVNTPVAGVSTGSGHYADIRVPTKYLQLVDPVTQTGGTSYVAYQMLDTTTKPVSLNVNDLVVVQTETSVYREVVQVTGSWFTPPSAANGTVTTLTPPAGTATWSSGTAFVTGQLVQPTTTNANGFWFRCAIGGVTGLNEPAWPAQFGLQVTDGSVSWVAIGASTTFSAVFQKPHDAGASVIAGNVPTDSSSQRFFWVVLTASAAADLETRRKVDNFMRKAIRGPSTWAIVAGTPIGGGPTYSVGPLSAGLPIGTAPFGSFTESP